MCCVVSSSEQFEDWAARCFQEGARAGQKLFRFVSHSPAQPPVAGGADSLVTFLDPEEVFPVAERGIAEMVNTMFRRETAKAREEGFQGVRLLADMEWFLARSPLPAQLTAYELRLDELVAELDATVVCVYRGDNDAPRLAEMVAIHPLTSGQPPTDLGFRLWNIDRGTWEIAGEVDESNVDAFGRALSAAAALGPVRRLRCAGLRFISAAGIRVLVEVALAHPGQAMMIQNASPILRQCWSILELERRLPQVRFQPATTGWEG